MPAKKRKLPNKNLYKVTDSAGHVHAKGTSEKNADAQVRILNKAHKDKLVEKRRGKR